VIEADVAIIGTGGAGLMCALHVAEHVPRARVVVLATGGAATMYRVAAPAREKTGVVRAGPDGDRWAYYLHRLTGLGIFAFLALHLAGTWIGLRDHIRPGRGRRAAAVALAVVTLALAGLGWYTIVAVVQAALATR
jgi:glycine/D-amino acid oxidase-like deaminating enzyme